MGCVHRLDERPAGRVRIKDDGILDCLLHFAGQGHNIVLCTLDKEFALRAQVWQFPPMPVRLVPFTCCLCPGVRVVRSMLHC